MINESEIDEKKYLEDIKITLKNTLEEINAKVRDYAKEVQEQKNYLWENKSGMDHVEKINVRESVNRSALIGEAVLDKSRRIRKLLTSPYFGRFDFIKEGKEKETAVYVWIHTFFDDKNNQCLIYDWRAPISTMFYDYEIGEAQFESPSGIISGKIVLKRQYRIRNGKMEFMLESSMNIHDDILQKELSCASDERMKNIVATIQRDQNEIIRNENSQVLIIQGVAGSGKTSIALHRIAFLLYKFKKTITSNDILIISPNKVFADYISNVLPELGEEKIPETGIEDLANDLLEYKYKFQTFFEQVTLFLEKTDKAFEKRIQFKASFEFFNKLKEYIKHIENTYFVPEDFTINNHPIPAWFMEERFKSHHYLPIVKRLNKIAKDIESNIHIYYNYGVTSKERAVIKSSVNKMFKISTLRSLYKDFYAWMGAPEMCKFLKQSTFEYSDVFPLIYLKMHWEGLPSYDEVKHLLVDEMQDYTPVQYAIISHLFTCKKTILGDANQSVNPFSSSSANEIQKVFPEADCVKLCKSYRSTYEITMFAQKISPNADLEVIERHGEKPKMLCFKSAEEEMQEILKLADNFSDSGFQSLGIICKKQSQAEAIYAVINSKKYKTYLLTIESESFINGITVCTAHMAKGLEFDHVIVPQATDENYATQIDRSMLYVACTRAMHKLTVMYVEMGTSFIVS